MSPQEETTRYPVNTVREFEPGDKVHRNYPNGTLVNFVVQEVSNNKRTIKVTRYWEGHGDNYEKFEGEIVQAVDLRYGWIPKEDTKDKDTILENYIKDSICKKIVYETSDFKQHTEYKQAILHELGLHLWCLIDSLSTSIQISSNDTNELVEILTNQDVIDIILRIKKILVEEQESLETLEDTPEGLD